MYINIYIMVNLFKLIYVSLGNSYVRCVLCDIYSLVIFSPIFVQCRNVSFIKLRIIFILVLTDAIMYFLI